ncbi:GAF domain-containing sensor histidine kinase [Aggregatilineales bacterium SYSU G02658]
MKKLIDENELKMAQQSLKLARNQIANGSIEPEFVLRQIDRATTLLEQIQDVQKTQTNALRFEALYHVTRILGTSLELDVVLEQVIDAVIQLTGAERGFIMLRDDDGNLRLKIGRNVDQQSLSLDQASYSRTIVNMVMDKGEALLTTNAVEDPRFQTGASILSQGLRSIMACPLRARGTVIGVAYVENRVVAGLFGPDDLSTMEALTSQASIAIDNAQLFSATDAELNHVIEELRTLRRIDLRLNEKLDYQAALDFTLETCCHLTEATAGCLVVADEDQSTLQAAASWPASDEHSANLLQLYPQASDVLRTAHSQLIFLEETSAALVPIHRENTVIAVMILERAQHAITAQQVDLVERVAARAAVTVENARLYAAVQAANRAKSEFVGIVAHDLKAPMTSIQGYADLLLMQPEGLSERQINFLERISGTVKRMEILVSDLSDISRIESGHFFLSETEVKIDDVIEAVRDQTMPQIQARGHTFQLDVAPALPTLYVDYYRLVQVLTNLLSNAYKYTPHGGTITLSVQPTGDRVRFSVSDTGIGLSPENVRKLGTKFWRAEDSFTRSQPGTGLGYAITRSIVEQMGSHIEITSQIGQGSTFTFTVASVKHVD